MLAVVNPNGAQARSEAALQNADLVDAVFRCNAAPHDRQHGLHYNLHPLREKQFRGQLVIFTLGHARRGAEPREGVQKKRLVIA